MIIIDNFIDSYPELKQLSLNCEFGDVKSPYDGITYPHIFMDIPENIQAEVTEKIEEIFGNVDVKMFMRMSPKGVMAPNIAHADNAMGQYTFIMYLFDNDDAGTALLRHLETGATYVPASKEYLNVLLSDSNNLGAWSIVDRSYARQNRAMIFDSERFHCSLPIGGFGDSQSDARIVLVAFFTVANGV